MRISKIMAVAALLCVAGCASTGRLKVGKTDGGEVVEAEGSCPFIDGDIRGAKECALRDAQKKALEKVIGVFISAKTRVDKAVTIEQNILANTQGFISKYDIVKEWPEGNYQISKIRALVLFQKLGAELKNLDILREPAIGLPRLAVIVTDEVGKSAAVENEVMHTYAANSLSRAMLAAGYKIVDPEALVAAKAYEAIDEAQSNSGALKALGVKLNAEIIVYGQAKASAIKMDNNMLGGMNSFRATLSAKASRAQTGEVLGSVSKQGSGLDATEDAALQKSLENVGEAAGKELASSLQETLSRETSIELTATNVLDFEKLEDLKKVVLAQSGVKDLYLRSFEGQRARIDIYLEGMGRTGADALGRALSQKLGAKVTTLQGNTLEVVLPSSS